MDQRLRTMMHTREPADRTQRVVKCFPDAEMEDNLYGPLIP